MSMEGWEGWSRRQAGSIVWIVVLSLAGCRQPDRVVVYTSQDHVYASRILKEFERETGIRVDAVYDSEVVKTVGLANRLLAEKENPQCDLFWNNEVLRTRQLVAQGVFDGAPIEFGYRSRRLGIHTGHLSDQSAPKTFEELTNSVWRGKVALGYPLFGTTATHFLTFRAVWGEEKWERWCRALAANEPFLVDGNSTVVAMVGRGEAWIGMTDSDDIAVGMRNGLPVKELPLAEDSLLIPNTAAVIARAPNRDNARRLLGYLQEPRVLDALVQAGALEGAVPPKAPTLNPDWDAVLQQIPPGTEQLRAIFLR